MSAQDELEALSGLLDDSADRILTAAADGLDAVAAARAGSSTAMDSIQQSLRSILEACSFHDLARQRLSRLAVLAETMVVERAEDPLLQGPAARGQGLDQSAADALFTASGEA